MKKLLFAGLFAVVVATPALAADEEYYLVKDTVGNCSAVISTESGAPGLMIISKKGYPSYDAATKELGGQKDCAGIVQ
jgi:hypothetical protein